MPPQEVALLIVAFTIVCVLIYSFLNNSKLWPKLLSKIRFRNDEVPENEPVFTHNEEVAREENEQEKPNNEQENREEKTIV